MDKNVGLWIDHHKAFLVTLGGKRETRLRLDAGVDRLTRTHGGSRSSDPHGGFGVASERKAERRRGNQLKEWYGEIADALGHADRIYLFGPGGAKRELLQVLETHPALGEKVVGMDSADVMTENQIAAKVREYYSRTNARDIPAYRVAPGA